MPQEILSIAIFEPHAGMGEQALATMRELAAVLSKLGYAEDSLYRDASSECLLVRRWKSEEARREAQENPEVQRCWAKVAHEITILKIFERLEDVTGKRTAAP
jgi:quinol monooxygenase YgiN